MIFISQDILNDYISAGDSILALLKEASAESDPTFTSHQWLLDSLPKRVVYSHLYGDLLTGQHQTKELLDVGGGYTSLTRILIKNYNYTLLDIMAHDLHSEVIQLENRLEQNFWINDDWYQFNTNKTYDVVLANDIFPNVDQRLDAFISKFLPLCRELRISLTYYNTQRWYKVKRTDGDEIFFMMAWDGMQVKRVLERFEKRIQESNLNMLLENPPSLFNNQRQICLIKLIGDVEYDGNE